jgi:hypothetical protein
MRSRKAVYARGRVTPEAVTLARLLVRAVAVGQSSAVLDFLCVCHKVMIFR